MNIAERNDVESAVIFALEQAPMTMAQLKMQTKLHDVPLTIAVRDLQNRCAIEHGYLQGQEWLEDYFDGDAFEAVVDAWRICKIIEGRNGNA